MALARAVAVRRDPRDAVVMSQPRIYRQTLDALEAGVRVPPDQQVEGQNVDPPRGYMDPEDLDRMRLLANPAGAGRLNPRR
jgi:hypothetical protein